MHSSRNRQVRESTVSSAVAAKEKICVLLPDTGRRKEEEEGADVSKKKNFAKCSILRRQSART